MAPTAKCHWAELGGADGVMPAKDGAVEAWARAAASDVPLLTAKLGLSEPEHRPRGHRMCAKGAG